MLSFLTPERLIATNSALGYHPLNTNLVGSCLSSWHYYTDITQQVSSVVYGIAKNHAFQDGNKRTAVVVYYVLCAKLHLPTLSDSAMFDTILQIAKSTDLTIEQVATLLFPSVSK